MSTYLIISPAWIGDAIMANALLRLLKVQQPGCDIDVLAPAWSHPVLARMPEIRDTKVMPLGHGVFDMRARYFLGRALRDMHYTHAIVLPNSWKSGLIPFFAHIPQRTGWRGEFRYGILNDLRVLDKKKYPLMVQRYLALGVNPKSAIVAQVPSYYPRLRVDLEQRAVAIKKYALTTTEPLLMLCPGAQYGNSKRWPEDYFSRVAQVYLDRGWQVALLGGRAESEIVRHIQAQLTAFTYDLTATTLSEAIDLLSLARVVVSNDSGLMHMACALDLRVVAIYGSSSPDFTPPLSQNARILSKTLPCKPCFQRECPLHHLHCLRNIAPEEVIAAIEQSITAP